MPISKQEETPSTTSAAYEIMAPRWRMIETLLQGTEAMRAAGEEFTPRHEMERDRTYNERVSRAVLVNLFELTVDLLAGKPFGEPIRLPDNMDSRLIEYADDIDLQGNDLDRFSYLVFRTALAKGFTHILVDTPAANSGISSLADERESGIRPYWVHIEPENMIFMQAVRIDGVEVLTHLRFYETQIVRDGFAEKKQVYIRVLELQELPLETEGQFTIRMVSKRWRLEEGKNNSEEWIPEPGVITDMERIPLQTFYTSRDGLMLCKPSLLDLAHMNIEHWQSYSDQISILTVTRFPLLAASGIDEDEAKAAVIGPRNLLATQDPNGKYYYVEHQGAAIEAGRKYLEDLETRMATYGASLLAKRPDRETAAARSASEESVTAPLKRMVMTFTDVLNTLFFFTAEMIGAPIPDSVKVLTEFSRESVDAVELQTLQVAFKEGAMSRVTLINELKRRGIISEEVDPDDDAQLLQAELALREAIANANKGGKEPVKEPVKEPNAPKE